MLDPEHGENVMGNKKIMSDRSGALVRLYKQITAEKAAAAPMKIADYFSDDKIANDALNDADKASLQKYVKTIGHLTLAELAGIYVLDEGIPAAGYDGDQVTDAFIFLKNVTRTSRNRLADVKEDLFRTRDEFPD